MGREQEELAILVTARDAASRVLKGVKGQVGALERAASKGAKNIASNIETAAVAGAVGAVALGGAAVKMAIDWETAFAGVRKTVEDTPENIAAIGAEIRKMATEIPVAATELAGIAETAGALGVTGKDNILNFTRVVALLGVTTDLTTESAATSLGHLRTTLGLTDTDYEHFGNTLVDLGNKGASTESQILGMAEGVAGVANVVGLSKDKVLGWGAAWANTGEEIEAGSTELQKFFLETFGFVNRGGKELKLLAKTSGMTAKQFAAAYRKDASGALEQFLVQLGKLSKAEQAATLEKLGFTDVRITRGLLNILGNTDNLSGSLDTASAAWKANNAMTNEAEKRFKTTAAGLQLLKNNVTEAGIEIGSELLPVINELAQEGVAWLQAHPDEIKNAAREIGEGFREAVTWAKSLNWDAIATALGAGAGAVKSIGAAFMALPAPVQGLLAGVFVANKFTGGAVGDVLGIGAKGLLRTAGSLGGIAGGKAGGAVGALGRLAAQPVFVTNWPMGGLGGPGGAGGSVPMAGMNAASRLALGGAGVLGLAGGSALLSAAPTLGDMPSQAAAGIGGGALTIGGGAATAAALGIAAPIGAAVGAALAVYQTQQNVSAASTAQAQQVSGTLDSQIAGGATLADLHTSLDAVNTGIHEITSNPLLTLVQGDALNELQAMRAKLETQIANETPHLGKEIDDLAAGMTEEQRNANTKLQEQRDAIERAKIENISGLRGVQSQVETSDAAVVRAIQSLSFPAPSIYVTNSVNVSGRSVTAAQTEIKRVGYSNQTVAS